MPVVIPSKGTRMYRDADWNLGGFMDADFMDFFTGCQSLLHRYLYRGCDHFGYLQVFDLILAVAGDVASISFATQCGSSN